MGAQSNCTILQVNYLQKLPGFYGESAPFWLLSCYKQHNSAIKTALMHCCVWPLKNYLLILVVLPHNLALCYAENAKADTLELVYISASTLTWFPESTLLTELSVKRTANTIWLKRAKTKSFAVSQIYRLNSNACYTYRTLSKTKHLHYI